MRGRSTAFPFRPSRRDHSGHVATDSCSPASYVHRLQMCMATAAPYLQRTGLPCADAIPAAQAREGGEPIGVATFRNKVAEYGIFGAEGEDRRRRHLGTGRQGRRGHAAQGTPPDRRQHRGSRRRGSLRLLAYRSGTWSWTMATDCPNTRAVRARSSRIES